MTDTWCIENDFAAQRELAAIEEARVFSEIEKLRSQLAASEQRVNELESENETLREIVSESCAAVGSTCICSTKASLDFMAYIPGEIRMTVDALQQRVNALEEAIRPIAKMWIDTKSVFISEGEELPIGISIGTTNLHQWVDISSEQLDAMVTALEATCQN